MHKIFMTTMMMTVTTMVKTTLMTTVTALTTTTTQIYINVAVETGEESVTTPVLPMAVFHGVCSGGQ
jgi:hypothetical protein